MSPGRDVEIGGKEKGERKIEATRSERVKERLKQEHRGVREMTEKYGWMRWQTKQRGQQKMAGWRWCTM